MGRATGDGTRALSAAPPDVSVVIPTHNRVQLLAEALGTALGQEGVDLEAIVVDDGSDDATQEFLASVGDPRLRVVRHEAGRGQSVARNAGVAAARGAWVAFLDDDDLWAPAKLRLQLAAARAQRATWVYCGVLLVSPEGDVVRMWGPPDPETLLGQLLRRNVVQAGASTVVAETARVRAVGGFDESLSTMGDWDVWIRLALDGPAASVEEPLAAYRRHPASLISGTGTQSLEEVRRVAERHRELARAHGVELDEAHVGRWLESERIRALRSRASLCLEDGRRLSAARLQLAAVRGSRSRSDLRRLLRIVAGDRVQRAVRRLVPAREPVEGEREPVPAWLEPYLAARRTSSATSSGGSAGATSSRAKNTLKRY